jgi:hypothetical protein
MKNTISLSLPQNSKKERTVNKKKKQIKNHSIQSKQKISWFLSFFNFVDEG